jgi:hypothetical protein
MARIFPKCGIRRFLMPHFDDTLLQLLYRVVVLVGMRALPGLATGDRELDVPQVPTQRQRAEAPNLPSSFARFYA